MKKTILFLLNKEVTYLPPFMAILDCLCEDYSLKVISYEKEGGKARLEQIYSGRDISFLSNVIQNVSSAFSERVKRKLHHLFNMSSVFYKEAIQLMENTQYDLLWIIHEETVREFKDYLIDKQYIISIYELNDYRRGFLEQIKHTVSNAKEVLIPEYNRACILRVWLKLTKTPTVIPNKPSSHPRKRLIENTYSGLLKDKKIILYQGYIQRNRNLNTLCEACSASKEYKVVLMGKGDTTYIEELKNNYPGIIHIPFVNPPEHLYITSYAHIAVVKYDMVSLNMIFCAPNKTWEYTGFGVPVLCNQIPGLEYTIGKYKAGICTDLDDIECIRAAIRQIDDNYDEFSRNATAYYESYNIENDLKRIVRKYIE